MAKAAGALRVTATFFVWLAGAYVLDRYDYLTAFFDIDHALGMIPVALVLSAAVGATVFIWEWRGKRFSFVTAAAAFLVLLSVTLFPLALRNNWQLFAKTPGQAADAPDLSVFRPFSHNSRTAKLDEAADLRIAGDQPVLDGATALYPVYAAFAEAVHDPRVFSPDAVLCSGTRGAYEALIAGERDIIFVAGPSKRQLEAAKAAGADLRFTPIGREAFVFVAGRNNPVENITIQQMRNIYSGKTARWATLGWKEGGKIIAFQRPEGSGSQTGLQKQMRGLPIQAPQPLPDASLVGTNSLMKQVSIEWRGVQPALGYSYRYYATTMYANPQAKLLSVDGVAPSVENIRDGSYPFASNFFAVTDGEPQGSAKLLIDWVLSPQGQELIEKTGYVPLR